MAAETSALGGAFSSAQKSDVIIVGAGIAGLTAALRLLDAADEAGQKLTVTILEADTVTGGRARTIHHEGFAINPGAQWFHGGDDNQLYQWALARYGAMPANLDSGEKYICFNEGHSVPDMYSQALIELEKVYHQFKAVYPSDDISLLDLSHMVDMPGIDKSVISIARSWMAVNSPSDVSADELFNDPASTGGWQLKAGTGSLLQLMHDELRNRGANIKTNARVGKITQSDSGVSVETDKGSFYAAKRAVVALPLAVLQNKNVQFSPSLSVDAQGYIDSVNITKFAKVVVPLNGDFFQDRGIEENTFLMAADVEPEMFCHLKSGGLPLATLMLGGVPAADVEKMTMPEIKKFVSDAFEKMPVMNGYKEAVSGAIYVTSWSVNPLFMGAYSAMKPGHHRRDPIIEGYVILCGEYLTGESNHQASAATLMGAWNSGLFAAERVFEALFPTANIKKPLVPPPGHTL